jgi:hypothetical protein
MPVVCLATFVQNPQRVLFVGNSLTFYNGGIDTCVSQIYTSLGKTGHFERYTIASQTLKNHFNDPAAISKIKNGNWDIVVLQGQSIEPIDPATRDDFYTYARKLDSVITKAGANTYFYMNWAYVDSGTAMFNRLHAAYDSIGRQLGAPVVPAGYAYQLLRPSKDSLNLYVDNRHATVEATYMTSCMFYGFFSGQSPIGLKWLKDGVTAKDGAILQQYAWKALISKHTYLDTAKKTVLINFNDSAKYNAAAPWNNTAIAPSPNLKIKATSDTTRHATGIRITCGSKDVWGGSNDNGAVTGNNSGVLPDLVMQENWWFQNENKVTLTISGLTPLRDYDFTFFGSRADLTDDRTTCYIIAEDTVLLNASSNSTKTVSIRNVLCDSSGEIAIHLEKAAQSVRYGYLGALIIDAYPHPIPVATKKPSLHPAEVIPPISIVVSQKSIQLQLPKAGELEMAVFDLSGRCVTRFNTGWQEANGVRTLTWPHQMTFGTGAYILDIWLDGQAVAQKMFWVGR